jgi:hypothetical protein
MVTNEGAGHGLLRHPQEGSCETFVTVVTCSRETGSLTLVLTSVTPGLALPALNTCVYGDNGDTPPRRALAGQILFTASLYQRKISGIVAGSSSVCGFV